MNTFDPTRPPSEENPAPVVPINQTRLSRSQQKRMLNASTKAIDHIAGNMERKLHEALDDASAARQRLEIMKGERATLLSILAACIKRNGTSHLVFDAADVQDLARTHKVDAILRDGRVSLTLVPLESED